MSIPFEPPDSTYAPEPSMAPNPNPSGYPAPRVDLGKAYGIQQQEPGFQVSPQGPSMLDQAMLELSERDRAEIEAERMLAQARAKEESKKRLKDVAVVDIIARDMAESQERSTALMKRLEAAQQRMAAPPPQLPTGVNYSPDELLAMLAGSVLAPGSTGQVIEAGQGMAQQRQQVEFQNRAQTYNAEQDAARTELGLAQTSARDETQYQRDLRRMQVGAAQDEQNRLRDEGKAKATRGRDLMAAYNAANQPGEKTTIAELWRSEYDAGEIAAAPPTREAVAADIQALRSPEVAREMTRYKSLLESYQRNYGSDPTAVAELEATRAWMIHSYFDGNEAAIPNIPTVRTLQEQKMAADKSKFDQTLALANKRFSFIKNVQFPQQMAARWASIEVLKANLQESMFRNNVYAGATGARMSQMDGSGGFGGGGNALGEFDAATGSFIMDFSGDQKKGAIKRLMDIDGKLANLKGQMRNKGALTGKKEDEIGIEISGLEAEKAHIVKMVQDMQGDRAQFGLQPVDPFQAARNLAESGAAARGDQFPRDRKAPSARPPKPKTQPPRGKGLASGVRRVG